MADPRHAGAGDPTILDRTDPPRAPDLGIDGQYRAALRLWHDPAHRIEKSFTISDFWRWWVVHLWVEQSFEFFAAAISAYLLMAVGLVSRQLAERSVYLALILIFLGGVLGTGHHLYWAASQACGCRSVRCSRLSRCCPWCC